MSFNNGDTAHRLEAELLISSAQLCPDSERAERIRALLRHDVNWPYLLRVAQLHGVKPLLYWHLKSLFPDAVPEVTLGELRDYFDDNTRRNISLTGELLRILRLFNAHGISAIPYKGPTLAALAYENLALREFCDLDILVNKQDVPRARDLLTSRQYKPQVQLDSVREAAFLESENVLLFRSDDGTNIVEIHWQLAPKYLSYHLAYDGLLERLEPVALCGKQFLTLSPEDLLLFLCVHGAKHHWKCLGWICDIARLVSIKQGIDWAKVVERSHDGGIQRMLSVGLLLASDMLRAPLPEGVSRKVMADKVARSLARKIHDQFMRDPVAQIGVIEGGLFHLRVKERLRHKFRYLLHLASTPSVSDWESLALPASLSSFYRLSRPFRLIKRYGPGLFKRQ